MLCILCLSDVGTGSRGGKAAVSRTALHWSTGSSYYGLKRLINYRYLRATKQINTDKRAV